MYYPGGAISGRKNMILETQHKTSLKHLMSKREAINGQRQKEIFGHDSMASNVHPIQFNYIGDQARSYPSEFGDHHQSNIKADRVSSIMHMNDAKEVK